MERPEYFNQRIDCDVTNCKYYDAYNSKCALGRISVSEKKRNLHELRKKGIRRSLVPFYYKYSENSRKL